MFRGYDRTKYDLNDASAMQAIARDRALHEDALRTVARHLATPPVAQRGAQIPQILLPAEQQGELTSQVPALLHGFVREALENQQQDHKYSGATLG